MKRRITILTIAFLSSVLMCANAFAAATGRCGDSITWTLDDSGNLTLSGSGEMWNNFYDVPPFKDYGIKTVTIGDGITSIGDYAFSGCSGLTELTLPNSVTSIGRGTFVDCSGLTELTLPSSVTSIGVAAFSSNGLEKITVESGNSRYDSRDNCNSIIETETNTLIAGCKSSIIPNSVTSIGINAFEGCSGLTKLTLPNSVTSIGERAFSFCSGMTELTLPNSVTSIGDVAFWGCTSLTELTLPNSVTSIGNSAFYGCSGLTELTLPSSVTSIEANAFMGCTGLTKLTFPSSVTSIEGAAFQGCSGLTELTLPNSVTSIGGYAFRGCTGLTKLTLPSSVTSIEEKAFSDCSGLAKITSLAGIPPVCGSGVFDGVNKTNCELIVPKGSVAAYKQAEGWKEFSNIRLLAAISGRCGDSITWTLDESCNLTLSGSGEMWNYGYDDLPFKDYEIRKATVGYGITSIGDYAFMGCTGMTELILPNSVTSIGRGTFVDCSGLAEITSLAEIPPVCGSGVFDGVNITYCVLIIPEGSVAAYKQAEGWKEFSIISGFTVISGRCGDSITWALYNSGNLTLSGSGEMWNYVYDDSPFKDYEIRKATIRDGITSIGDYAFMGCTGMTELTLLNSVTSIGKSAFKNCGGLEKITSLAEIPPVCGSGVFDGVNRTNCELIIPEGSVAAYTQAEGWKEFSNIRLLAAISGRCGDSMTWTLDDSGNLTLSGSGEMWNYVYDDSPFKGYEIRKATIEYGITSIGDYAFMGCTGMTELTLPNSVTSIGRGTFVDCSGLTELTLPSSVTSIGVAAFSSNGLEKITVESGNSRYDSRDNCNSIIETETNTLIAGCKSSIIPNSVTSIGINAFEGCSGLTKLTLPNSVTSIGERAFSFCSGLTELTLPSSVASIGVFTFAHCSGLTELTLPNSVTSIGWSAFQGCSGMTKLILPNSVTSIEGYAFQGCSGLAKITSLAGIPPVCGSGVFDGVNKTNCELIVPKGSVAAYKQAEGWKEFSNIRLLAAISGRCGDSITWTLDESCNLTLSGSGEMWNYNRKDLPFKDYGIKTVTIGDGITSIGDYAFVYCSGMTELTLPSSVTSIGRNAFYGCSGLTKLTLPNSVKNIGDYAFMGCTGLTELTLPSSVTSIGWYAFKGCSGLTKLTLPNSVKNIGESAFFGCSGLTELTLPNSVKNIGNSAFKGCSGLSEITSLAGIPPVCGSGVFDGVNKTNCELIVPKGSVAAYKQAYGWNGFSNISGGAAPGRCGDSITWALDDSGNLTLSGSGEIWDYNENDLPFRSLRIKTVTIGDGITRIGDSAFQGCSGLTELTLPNSVTSIGYYAFYGCSGLTELILPNSVTSIGGGAFYSCRGLTELTLSNSLTSIGKYAFEGCSGLTELTLPSSVTSIGESAFQGCSGLTKLTLPNSVTSIGESAFRGCRGLTELTLPNSITSIGDYAFYSCRGLTELTLSNSLTSIGKYAFKGCIGLEKITSLAEIPPMCGRKVFDGVNKTNCELIVPEESVAAYTQAEVWNEFSNIRGFSGVDVTEADGNTIIAIGNQIEISGDFTSVEVYGVNGTLIYKGKDNVVTVPSAGIYLVHVAGKTRKIVVE